MTARVVVNAMNEKQGLDFLYSLRNLGSKFGLERMQDLVQELGHPQTAFPSIHVAGTNGKGSVCAMLEAIYREHGYRVGLFTSPHLVELGERIRVDGRILPLPQIFRWVNQIKPIAERMAARGEEWYPSFFEFITAVAFLEFQEKEVDIAIIETGLGGRLDSTNVIFPELSLITSISLDHCEILGNTLSEIAKEKAGILKKGVPGIWGWLDPEAERAVERISSGIQCLGESLSGLPKDQFPQTNLQGSHQSRNAAMAQHAVTRLSAKFPVEPEKISSALMKVGLPGRWQILPGSPRVILDACHNEGAVAGLLENLSALPNDVDIWYACCGKDRAESVLPSILPFCSALHLFELNQPRASSPKELHTLVSPGFSGSVFLSRLSQVSSIYKSVPADRVILVTGSIYLIGEVLLRLKKHQNAFGTQLQDIW